MWPGSTSNSTVATEMKTLTEQIHNDYKLALQVLIPRKILALTEFMIKFCGPNSHLVRIKNPNSSTKDLDEEPNINKKRKLDDTGSNNQHRFSSDDLVTVGGEELTLIEEFKIWCTVVQIDLRGLIRDASILKLSRSLSENSSVESMQDDEECIAEFNKAIDAAQRALGDPLKFYTARANLSLSIEQHPNVPDYVSARNELDHNAIRNAKECVIRIRDTYLILIQISQKHLAFQ